MGGVVLVVIKYVKLDGCVLMKLSRKYISHLLQKQVDKAAMVAACSVAAAAAAGPVLHHSSGSRYAW